MIGTAMRGEMIFAPCIIFIYYAVRKEISIKYYLLAILLGLFVVGFIPFYRMIVSYGNAYIHSIKSISTYPEIYSLVPIYQTFSNNFLILHFDFEIFPHIASFGYGIYSILPEIPFFDLGSSLMQVQNIVMNNRFYAGLTATYLASWYADFGYIGCFISTIAFALFTNYVYRKYTRERNLFSCVWYAYVFYSSLWLFYNSVFDFVFICYSLVIWLVLRNKVKLKS
jgi:oligosaccharide repeat unit polymerase